jgi:branched-chain amino acid transport system substrate-binding protein
VLLASVKPAFDSKTFLISANAGPHQLAGEGCSPYFFSTSWQNDQTPQAMGMYMNTKGVKSVYLIGPNYAAGKDMLKGVSSTFKGKVLGQDLTTWPSQLDFSAELAKIAAAVGDGVVTSLKITGPTAPSWRKGRLHIAGRGPRDTYG